MALFTKEQKRDLLITAFEGGSNYWYLVKLNINLSIEELIDKIFLSEDFTIYDVEEPETILGIINLEKLKKAEELMSTDYKNEYRNIINENWDANSADIYFQLATMGEVVYG